METDVLIIGAGPAGLEAAFETAVRGLDVMIVDESFTKGGQLIQQTQLVRFLPASYSPMRGFELAQKLVDQLENLPVHYLLGHRVIGMYKDGTIGVTDEKNVFPVKAKKIIVATGAAEKGIPFPKWTLPGIMTIGAAQTLINRDLVLPGENAVILGSSDFALDVALQLSDVGVKVKGIFESRQNIAARDLDKHELIDKSGIPVYLNASVKEARGQGKVEEIDIGLLEEVITEKVDFVCVDGGRAPILDVFYQCNCSFGYQETLGGWLPQYNKRMQTSHEHVYLAGNAAGITTQGFLLVTGRIAGISVCEALGVLDKEKAEQLRSSMWKELETLETKLFPDSWHARVNHVENFKHPLLKDQFLS
ncbi:NAD(P)/FAD-dependent oxidoreductase [Neobacillus sp. 114]|uniref:NAD(P)/FAD-dependent oxidoreductase n=1 Tax=Neobacillus sp. 114 TaxID=3048535 RepID=UPI0024C2FB5F|nr:NAD(P)/FAD-dependent oxidoreductase [Neobacillus sp. 114]